jgi:hypothetical protein
MLQRSKLWWGFVVLLVLFIVGIAVAIALVVALKPSKSKYLCFFQFEQD